ncbi:MAG: formylglycine-generating enzyme family protein [Candidatus Electrothrix sp. AR5]|nr:formylglycine-generating enzyme family protein [Candidatus Electrothrix sp. AR5]
MYADLSIPHQKGKEVVQRFRWIPAGTFMMGSLHDETERFSDEDYHKVTLTKGYWLADTAVTQGAWQAITGKNTTDLKYYEQNPVVQVSWDDVQEFIVKLTRRMQRTEDAKGSMLFRLPTEAEWEHACRAGTETPFSFGANITPEQVKYDKNYPYADGEKGRYREATAPVVTVPVKFFPPNPWGLYEMHGNVWEWCADTWQEHLGEQAVSDPYNDDTDSYRVVRGSSFFGHGRHVRSACRHHDSLGNNNLGFRLALGHELRPHGGARNDESSKLDKVGGLGSSRLGTKKLGEL